MPNVSHLFIATNVAILLVWSLIKLFECKLQLYSLILGNYCMFLKYMYMVFILLVDYVLLFSFVAVLLL